MKKLKGIKRIEIKEIQKIAINWWENRSVREIWTYLDWKMKKLKCQVMTIVKLYRSGEEMMDQISKRWARAKIQKVNSNESKKQLRLEIIIIKIIIIIHWLPRKVESIEASLKHKKKYETLSMT